MKKQIISLFLTVAMIVGMLSLGAMPAFAKTNREGYLPLHGSHDGQSLGEPDVVAYYDVDSDVDFISDKPGVSGLSIRDYAEVHIYVEEGATLTCIGGDASGMWIGGGAGIEVPEHAKLYLEGEGTVIAQGGAAADGGDGIQGGSASYEEGFYFIVLLGPYQFHGGNGGRGGTGGAGAGAGIGTVGSMGGTPGFGGMGDGGDADEDHEGVTPGTRGFPGAAVNPVGTIRTSRTVKLTAVGGEAGKGGNSTISNGLVCFSIGRGGAFNTAVPGCSGGGGQGGGAGASVGTGGQGGGGGAGGNGSPAIARRNFGYYGAKLFTGYGGGNTDGHYVEGSNMGKGGEEFILTYSEKVRFSEKEGYPYLVRNPGGAGGANGVHVHTFDEDGWCVECTEREWIIDENGVLLKYNGYGGEIVIPEGVTKIANNVFNGIKELTGVVFPSTLEEIGSSAFNGSGLTSVSFPSSVKTIGHNAFQNCKSLTSVTFPEEGEITILNSTFQGLPLTSVDIPVSVKAIGYNAFRECANLKNVIVHWTEADKIVTPLGDAFTGIASDCMLHVPSTTVELYKNRAVWGKFTLVSYMTPYMAYDLKSKTFIQKTTPEAPVLTSSDDPITLTGEWYSVDGDVTIGERITVPGDVNLILKDGSKLTLSKGLEVSAHGSLTIYGQVKGTGELKTPRLTDNTTAIVLGEYAALNIHGGIIDVNGGKTGSGIGGGYQAHGGTVTVYGGSVKAQGYYGGTGIGNDKNSYFIIYGGKVDAYGDNAAGIAGNVTINGGEVDANNAIGGLDSKVVINDGKVTLNGDNSTIGGMYSTVEINGGDIKVNNGTIGVPYFNGTDAEITIRGGNIDAFNYYYPAIGGNTNKVNVNVYGGNIKAQSKNMDAVIATSFKVYPNAKKCEIFTVKDSSGNELTGSPVSEEKDIAELLSGNNQIQIDPGYAHTGMSDFVCDRCGYVDEAGNALFDAKTAATQAIDNAAGLTPSEEMKEVISQIKADIDNAETPEEVVSAMEIGLQIIEEQKQVETTYPDVCPKCGKTHADNFWGKIVCFFNRVFNWLKNLF